MVWGPPGIGKSDIVAYVARELGRPLIDIRLPLLEPTDMRGIPYLAEVKVYNEQGELLRDELGVPVTDREFRWSPPSDLPTDKLSNALYFLMKSLLPRPACRLQHIRSFSTVVLAAISFPTTW
jgi:hypothetical protein